MYPSESGKPPPPGSRTIVGYAAKWNVASFIQHEGFDEVFLPHAFVWDASLFACANHDRKDVIGRLSDGSLDVVCDDIGLRVELTPSDYEIVGRTRTGGFKGFSVSFVPIDQAWSRPGGSGPRLRTIVKAELIEISLAWRGAHVTTLGLGNRREIWSANERAEQA